MPDDDIPAVDPPVEIPVDQSLPVPVPIYRLTVMADGSPDVFYEVTSSDFINSLLANLLNSVPREGFNGRVTQIEFFDSAKNSLATLRL